MDTVLRKQTISIFRVTPEDANRNLHSSETLLPRPCYPNLHHIMFIHHFENLKQKTLLMVNAGKTELEAPIMFWHVPLGHLDPWSPDRLLIPKRNVVTSLCCVQSQKIAGLKTCSISVCPSIRRMQYGGIYKCMVTLHQKMSNRGKSHDLPGQGIGPALSIQHCCCSFKSFFISKNH